MPAASRHQTSPQITRNLRRRSLFARRAPARQRSRRNDHCCDEINNGYGSPHQGPGTLLIIEHGDTQMSRCGQIHRVGDPLRKHEEPREDVARQRRQEQIQDDRPRTLLQMMTATVGQRATRTGARPRGTTRVRSHATRWTARLARAGREHARPPARRRGNPADDRMTEQPSKALDRPPPSNPKND